VGNFGPVDIDVAREPPGCTHPSDKSGAIGYVHAIICGSLTTYCVYEENPVCDNYMIPSEPGNMGNQTRDGLSTLFHSEGGLCDLDHDGRDEFEEVFDTSVFPPVVVCASPRVAPIFVIRDFQDADIHPKTNYIHHFAALYIEGCLLKDGSLDEFCDDESNFKVPGQTQVRVRFGELMSSASAGGGQPGGYINVVSLIK